MKAEEPIIICCYSEDGATVEDCVLSSFAVFLGRELEKFPTGASGYAGELSAWSGEDDVLGNK